MCSLFEAISVASVHYINTIEDTHLLSLAFSAIPTTRFSILHLGAMVWTNISAKIFTHVGTYKYP